MMICNASTNMLHGLMVDTHKIGMLELVHKYIHKHALNGMTNLFCLPDIMLFELLVFLLECSWWQGLHHNSSKTTPYSKKMTLNLLVIYLRSSDFELQFSSLRADLWV